MSQVSRRIIKKNIAQKIDKLLLDSLNISSHGKMSSEFLDDLLTPTEKIMLTKRLAIAYLLLKGYPYQVINQTLKVSNPTIRTIALILQYKGRGLRYTIDKLLKVEKWRNFFEELGDLAVELVGMAPGSNWKSTKSYLHRREILKQSPL
ncbi:hypothetical protein HY407_01975 [Candidatus Gottesmanbacteria bacterium]|nr:hypothetical protein [Candidatus Gottesmanbacteria bacterium]